MDWVVLGQQVWYGLVNAGLYIMFASGLTLCLGCMRIFNMAHGELCMLGAILAYSVMTHLGINYYLAAVVSVTVVAGFGIILNRVAVQPLLNLPMMVLLSTLGVSFILLHGSLVFWGLEPKRIKVSLSKIHYLGGVAISDQSIMIVVVGAITISALYFWLAKARLGKAMRATAQNAIGASLSGINTKRIYDYTMMLSAGLAALTGVLLAILLSAHASMGQPILLMGFVIVVAGGMGNFKGAIIVGLAVGIVEALFGQYVSTYYRSAFIYGIMMVVLLLRPKGLFGAR